MSTLEVTLFGTLSVRRVDAPLPQFPSGKIKQLFAFLLLNRHAVHPREQLAGLFWGDEADQRARHCLNTALWRLNRVLAQSGPRTPYLRVDAQNIGFNTASDFHLDVDEFESRCTLADQIGTDAPEKQAALYRQAVARYRGDLLVDCYEDWCLIERERFRCLYIRALGRLLTYHSVRGAHDDAVDCARRILSCDPLREDVHRDLIELFLAINHPADALRQYRTCEGLLARELAVEPMPETRALLHRIIGAAPRLDHLVPTSAVPGSLTAERALRQKLHAATVQLREAAGAFDRGRIQLQEATALVEEIMREMRPAAPIPIGAAHMRAPRISEELRHAVVLLDGVAQSFGQSSGTPAGHAAVGGMW